MSYHCLKLLDAVQYAKVFVYVFKLVSQLDVCTSQNILLHDIIITIGSFQFCC